MVKNFSSEKIRNISIVGHGGVGKTSFVEAMLFSAGVTTRLGKVEEGNTVTDYTQEEIDRQVSINTALACTEWKNHKLNILDTPGYSDFIGNMIGAVRVADTAIILLSSTAGVEVGTESAWQIIRKQEIPTFIVINRMDKEHSNFEQCFDMARVRFGNAVIQLQLPANEGEGFNQIVDLIKMKLLTFNDTSGKYTESALSGDLAEKAGQLRKQLEESIAENDEKLMEKYFETEKLDEQEFLQGLRREIKNKNIIPIFCSAATTNVGVSRIMEFIVDFAPAPSDTPEIKGVRPGTEDVLIRKTTDSEFLSALVFKTIAEQHVGELSLFRVYSGTLKSGLEVYNSTRNTTEKIGQMYFINGKTRKETSEVQAGDIVGIVKLKSTHTGDSICDKKNIIELNKIEFPAPVTRTAITPKNKGDEDKIGTGLNSLHEEDPTFSVRYDQEIKQMLMYGQGELQFDIAVKRLKDKFSVEVDVTEPRIPYRETIRKKVEAQGKYKKQSGGRGQYGDCHLRIEPQPSGTGFEFADEVVGGVIPGKYIPAIEKGVREAMVEGVIAGYPVVDIRVAVYFGSYHSVDSSDMAFKVAGSMAFKKAFLDAKPVLLEPIYNVEITVPEEYMGDVMGDISSRRGKIQGMEAEGPFQIIKAKVPLSELYKYSTTLRSLTQGRGIHSRAFSHYDEVPAEVQAKIVGAYKSDKEE
jgi:elongation factor G